MVTLLLGFGSAKLAVIRESVIAAENFMVTIRVEDRENPLDCG